jgi:CMP-N,N'-diacetyllegionaminic acid synthase
VTRSRTSPRDARVLGIIPARGGSKGLPRKNLLPLCGRPLIAWTIAQARASSKLSRCILSSDDAEIIATAQSLGADVPFRRPAEYATDDSPASAVVLHALDTLAAEGDVYEFVAWLEPTSPLRRPHDIDAAISMITSRDDCDAVISVSEVHMEHPRIVKRIEHGFLKPYITSNGDERISRRQELDPAHFPYGVIYLGRVSVFREQRTFYTDRVLPYPLDRWQNYEVDDADDLIVCEAMMRTHMSATWGGAQ